MGNLKPEVFGYFNGKPCHRYFLGDKSGIEISLTDFGARILTFKTPDRMGKSEDIVCGYKTFEDLTTDRFYFGCTVGRFANRIANGRFSLDADDYQVIQNDGQNSLHGGDGFDKRVWECIEESDAAITFRLSSPDLDAGYPGNLVVDVTYAVIDQSSLVISYSATTDKTTVINLTNHAYFNLGGVGGKDISHHELRMNAEAYLPINENFIPTGEIASVRGGSYDFTVGRNLGVALQQLSSGIDHCYVLEQKSSGDPQIELFDPCSGRVLEITTSQPSVQLYTGNFLDGSISGVGGKYERQSALCLETQRFPDAPNQPSFPSSRLECGEIYVQTTRWDFTTR